MALKSTLIFLGIGVITSRYAKTMRYPVTLSTIGMFSLLYTGSMMEFDNLVTQKTLSKIKPGFWVIGSGAVCAGLGVGTAIQKCREVMARSKR